MPTMRNGESREDFRKRSNERDRARYKWCTERRTVRADGSIISETQRPEPTLVEQKIPGASSIRFTTTVYDREGRPDRQFVRVEPDKADREAAWEAMLSAMRQDLPRLEPLPAPSQPCADHLLTAYPIGDHHLGMLAWPPETGAAYDVNIGEELLVKAMTNLVGRAPRSGTALIVILGDFFHYDSFQTVTPQNRNLLDSDTRYPKMIDAGYRIIRRAIDLALMKHNEVHLIVEMGNHDPATSVHFALALKHIYENEPRVSVDTSPRNCHFFKFGNSLIGVHHGDKIKLTSLPLIMATDRPEDWGATQHRYWFTGHVHHYQAKEVLGVVVESFGILAPGDAYNTQEGYRAARTMKAITYHREFGEVDRMTVNPRMLEIN